MTSRYITTHAVVGNQFPDLVVKATDDYSPEKSHTYYSIEHPQGSWGVSINFQNGVISENGINGVTIEALLAICLDRLQGFQAGKYPCKENQHAIDNLEWVMKELKSRTTKRLARGVESTMVGDSPTED